MEPNPKAINFVILAILDGWGIAKPGPGNAIYLSKALNINHLWKSYPHTELLASGEAVGLPHAEPGNTETGHLNLGAGRIIYQDLARINMSIADGSFFANKELLAAITYAKQNQTKLHVMGLLGAGGVHSSLEHLFALLQLCAREKFKEVYLHLFTDGRDSPQTSSLTYINELKQVIAKNEVGKIASIMGRYWAMDRDLRWERTTKAFNALTKGEGGLFKTIEEIVTTSYEQGKTDEFIEPALIISESGQPLGTIGENDAVIFFNFRIDRPRQLTRMFLTNLPKINFVMMTEYSKELSQMNGKVAFPPEVITTPLGMVISSAGLRQLRVSESEKERFVTFYFNGQNEQAFLGEERVIVPSPKVPTYDMKPEMSAREITNTLMEKIKTDGYKLVVVNFANADMVGHTGNIGAAVSACEVLDECIGKLSNFVLAYSGALLITADHGNAEEMLNLATNQVNTEHSANPVPFIAVSQKWESKAQMLQTGILADVAPTILKILNLPIPTSMTGRALLSEAFN